MPVVLPVVRPPSGLEHFANPNLLYLAPVLYVPNASGVDKKERMLCVTKSSLFLCNARGHVKQSVAVPVILNATVGRDTFVMELQEADLNSGKKKSVSNDLVLGVQNAYTSVRPRTQEESRSGDEDTAALRNIPVVWCELLHVLQVLYRCHHGATTSLPYRVVDRALGDGGDKSSSRGSSKALLTKVTSFRQDPNRSRVEDSVRTLLGDALLAHNEKDAKEIRWAQQRVRDLRVAVTTTLGSIEETKQIHQVLLRGRDDAYRASAEEAMALRHEVQSLRFDVDRQRDSWDATRRTLQDLQRTPLVSSDLVHEHDILLAAVEKQRQQQSFDMAEQRYEVEEGFGSLLLTLQDEIDALEDQRALLRSGNEIMEGAAAWLGSCHGVTLDPACAKEDERISLTRKNERLYFYDPL